MYLTLKKRMQVIMLVSGITGILVWAFVNYHKFQSIWFDIPSSHKLPYVFLSASIVLFAHKWIQLSREEKKIRQFIK